MAVFPSGIKTWTDRADNVDDVVAADINQAYAEIIAVQNALGINLSNIVKATLYTALDVLTKLKTVDGAGSGLDGDTVDGYHASDLMSYTNTAISGLIGAAPDTLNTLSELAAALGNDPNFSATVLNAIAAKADISHTHAPADIVQDSSNRFVTDAEKDAWNRKQNVITSGSGEPAGGADGDVYIKVT
jgi:hypothetical protein